MKERLQHLKKAVVVISSSDSETGDVGSGFLIARNATRSYFVTCAHVIDAAGGEDKVRAGPALSTVVIMGESDGFDAALLSVKNQDIPFLADAPLLRLAPPDFVGQNVGIIGWAPYSAYSERDEILGNIRRAGNFSNRARNASVVTWEIEVAEGKTLKEGYSGSPVIDLEHEVVLGIVITKDGDESGRIISIEALLKLAEASKSEAYEVVSNAIDNRAKNNIDTNHPINIESIIPGLEGKLNETERRRLQLRDKYWNSLLNDLPVAKLTLTESKLVCLYYAVWGESNETFPDCKNAADILRQIIKDHGFGRPRDVTRFLSFVAILAEIISSIGKQWAEQWLSRAVRDMEEDLPYINIQAKLYKEIYDKLINAPNSLIINIVPSNTDPSKKVNSRYFVTVLRYLPTINSLTLLEFHEQIDLKELQVRIGELKRRVDLVRGSSLPLRLEFLLPFELLTQPDDSWMFGSWVYEEEGLGLREKKFLYDTNPIVVRCQERLYLDDLYRSRELWKQKWDALSKWLDSRPDSEIALEELIDIVASSLLGSPMYRAPNQWEHPAYLSAILPCHCFSVDFQSAMRTLVTSGIPFGFWPVSDTNIVNEEEVLLLWFCNDRIYYQMPEYLWSKRRNALDKPGDNIVVFWDDPARTPDDSMLISPGD